MARHRFWIVFVLFFVVWMTACGSDQVASTPVVSPSTSPVSLTVGDDPPDGVSVLAFQVTMQSAVLQPGDVNVLAAPTDIELSRMEVNRAFINTLRIPSGVYNSIEVTYSNPVLTFLNASEAEVAGCPVGEICKIKPEMPEPTATFSDSPFPIYFGADKHLGLLIDLNLANTIQTDLSLVPEVSVSFSLTPSNSHPEKVEAMSGTVTALDPSRGTVNIKPGVPNASAIVLSVDSSTQFQDFDLAGLTNKFESLAVGQVLEVDAVLQENSTLTARKIELEDNVNDMDDIGTDIKGVVTALNYYQFKMVVTDNPYAIANAAVGDTLVIDVAEAKYTTDESLHFMPPSDVEFRGPWDMSVGQLVAVHLTSPIEGEPLMALADHVRLEFAHVTATVKELRGGTVILESLPSLFATAFPPVSTIEVRTTAATELEGVGTYSDLAVGDTVSVSGMMFRGASPIIVDEKTVLKTLMPISSTPVMMAKKIRKR